MGHFSTEQRTTQQIPADKKWAILWGRKWRRSSVIKNVLLWVLLVWWMVTRGFISRNVCRIGRLRAGAWTTAQRFYPLCTPHPPHSMAAFDIAETMPSFNFFVIKKKYILKPSWISHYLCLYVFCLRLLFLWFALTLHVTSSATVV